MCVIAGWQLRVRLECLTRAGLCRVDQRHGAAPAVDAMGFDAKVTHDTINYVVAAFESGIGLALGGVRNGRVPPRRTPSLPGPPGCR